MDKYILSLLLTSIVAPALAYYLARWKLKDELAAVKEKAPYEVLTNALKQRDAQLEGLVLARSKEAQADKAAAASDKAASDKATAADREKASAERIQLAQVLTKVAAAMDAIKDELVEHRREERERIATVHNRLNEIQKDLWATRGGNGGSSRG